MRNHTAIHKDMFHQKSTDWYGLQYLSCSVLNNTNCRSSPCQPNMSHIKPRFFPWFLSLHLHYGEDQASSPSSPVCWTSFMHCFKYSWSFSLIPILAMCCASSVSCVWLFATPGTGACQARLFMGIVQAQCWSGLPCLPPRDLVPLFTQLLKSKTKESPLIIFHLFFQLINNAS